MKNFRKIAEARKGEEFKETDLTMGQTAIEFEDANEVELGHFLPASRITGKTLAIRDQFNMVPMMTQKQRMGLKLV